MVIERRMKEKQLVGGFPTDKKGGKNRLACGKASQQ